jgi:UDPglucose 6-dehydrogenase
VAAFIKIAEGFGYDFELLKAVQKINDFQRNQVIRKAKGLLGDLKCKTMGMLGLSYKPDTNDMREAPSIHIIGELMKQGVYIKAYDPQAMKSAKILLPDIEYCMSPYEAASGCDALLILTEWDEFKNLDFPRIKQLLKQPVIIDGRNIFDPGVMKEYGFVYAGIGH